jgi:drug/metabolite transporter (DMT)-like permease
MTYLRRGSALVLSGSACVVAAWFLFALHDASVKLLVADLSAWQVLFARSLVVLPLCGLAGGQRCIAGVVKAPIRGRLLLNALVYALAWVAYYTAARDLQLAELETIYYLSPVIATVLAVLLLGEQVPLPRWIALAIGFLGVVLACHPHGLDASLPMVLLLLGAGLWAWSVVLTRQLSSAVSTATQLLFNNAVFLVVCGIAWPWWGGLPSGRALLLLLGIGLVGFVAQYLLYEGIRRARASVVAPLEYTGLLWAFALGFAIWGDIPEPAVFAGAALIILSGLLIIAMEEQWLEPAPGGSTLGSRLRRSLSSACAPAQKRPAPAP